MHEKDLHSMSEHYRRIRKTVYEEGTRPLSNNADLHIKNKHTFKQIVNKLCNDANLNNYLGTDKETATKIWHHLWTKNRYAGIRSSIATKEIDDIKNIFDNYDIFSGEDWNIQAHGNNLIYGGSQVHSFCNRTGEFESKQTIGNIPKLVKIVSVARQLTEFFNRKSEDVPILDFICSSNTNDIWETHEYLLKIGYRSDLTALHFMMDMGFQVIKPDIVISTLFLEWGWLHKKISSLPKDLKHEDLQGKGKYGQRYKYTNKNIYKPAIDLARDIVFRTNQEDLKADIGWVTCNPLREFDIFIVKYGQKPEKQFGIERTLYEAANTGNKNLTSCAMQTRLTSE
jgi:hypothetical protein